MRKKLPISILLFVALLSSFSLKAINFTISGKVSIVEAAVPLPFQEVSIADGEGKYIATVTTSLNGTYSHTFDIPAEERVFFEVSVLDRCTNESIIVAFEREGESATADFTICSAEQEEAGNDGEEEEGEPCICPTIFDPVCVISSEGVLIEFSNSCVAACEGYSQFIDCSVGQESSDCDLIGLNFPVCAITEDGTIVSFDNPCIAFEEGYEWQQLQLCADGGANNPFDCGQLGFDIPLSVCVEDETGQNLEMPICEALNEGFSLTEIEFCNGLGGLGGLELLGCEFLGIDIPINVCVQDDMGETLVLPLCGALAEGFPLSQIEFCEIPGEVGGLDSIIDCAALGIVIPVCVLGADGEEMTFESPCAALDAGFAIDQLELCEVEGGGLGDFDCASLGFDFPIPVCVTNEAGDLIELPICEALAEGFDLSSITLCDGNGLNCEELGIAFPVCIIDEEGNKTMYDTPCEAIQAGNTLNQLTLCEGLGEGGGLGQFDCSALEIEVPITVCVELEDGSLQEFIFCDALAEGFSLDQITFCDGTLDDIDCAALGVNIPVCVVDASGNTTEFSNPCEALAAGNTFDQLTLCDGLIGDVIDDLDCENIGLDLPFTVCVTDNEGTQQELLLCDAISQGISLEDIEFCNHLLDEIGEDDCEGLGLNFPICVINAEGQQEEFANPCAAIAAGVSIDEVILCDNFMKDAAEATGLTNTKDLVPTNQISVFPNPAQDALNIELNFAKNSQYELRILSIDGNAIYRQKYQSIDNQNMSNIDVSSLDGGIYLLQIITDRSSQSVKFIKQ